MKTSLAEVEAQIQKFWSPLFVPELREQLLLGALVNKDYQGEITKKGDTVKVSQIIAPEGNLKTIGVDADTFEAESLQTKQIEIKADKRATAAFEFEDLVDIQSQIEGDSSPIREALLFSVNKQINDHLFTFVNPQTAPINNVISGVATMDADDIVASRVLGGQNKWMKNKPWWMLLDPVYHGDLLKAQTLTSSDYVDDRPVIAGEIPNRRHGFNILEDNSRSAKYGLAFHPDFLHLVMQTEARFKISDLHAQKKFGYLISVDLIFGAKLGIDGRELHIKIEA